METVTSTPTVKQRRKFERIETANMNNHDTSSVNHVSNVYAIGKLSKREHEVPQTLADCCKESIEKCVLQEKNVFEEKFIDKNTSIARNNPMRMNKFLFYGTTMNHLVITIVGFSLTYSMCKQKACANTVFLYISDTARDFPESNIFCLTLNWIAGSVTLSIYVRHLLTLQVLWDHGQDMVEKMKVWVRLALWTGLMTALSIQMVGTFPAADMLQFSLHFAGVISFFVFLIIYVFAQNILTYHMIGLVSDRRIYYIRLALSMTLLITSFAAIAAGAISWMEFNGNDTRKWRPSNGGWTCHVISVLSEWIYVIVGDFYIMSFAYEFRTMRVDGPVVKPTYLTTKGKMDSKTGAL